MKLFDKDSPWIRLIDNLGNLVLLNLLYLLFCLPLVTAPAATTALYSCTLSMNRREPLELSRFFRVFKQDFLISLKAGLVLLLLGALLALDYLLLGRMRELPMLFVYLLYVFLFLLACEILYVFPLIARFDNSLKQYFRLGLAFALRYLPRTLTMLAAAALPVLLFLLNAELALRLMIFWVMFGVALTAYVNSRLLTGIFARYEPGDEN